MATLEQLLNTMQTQVSRVTTGLRMFDADLTVMVGKYWPPVRTLQQNVKMQPPGALVTIYDQKFTHDTTRWMPSVTTSTVTTTEIVPSPDTLTLPPGASAQFSYSGPVQPGDAVSLVATNRRVILTDPGDGSLIFTPARAVVDVLVPGATVDDVPATLAALTAADVPGLGEWLTCTASGSTLTVTSLVPEFMVVNSFAGNGGTVTTELARRARRLQIVTWAPSPEIRSLVCDRIEELVTQIELFRGEFGEFEGGLTLPDQLGARLTFLNDTLVDDAVLSDTFRRDIVVAVDYGITTTDQLYSVLAPITSYNFTA